MKSYVLGFCLAGSNILSLLSSNPTIAQIAADETLIRNTVVRQQGNVTVIEGGIKAGANLYHSFGSFSVPTGATAFFDNSLDILNIISRVTGKSISNIDGLIRASGTANLFLINPAGIIFGQNARLDVGGSFIGSTADSIKFADGLEFSAINPQSTPLLSINVPVGLQMGQNPGSITVQGNGYDLSVQVPIFSPINRGSNSTNLQVQLGKSLALVGGNVNLGGSTLIAEEGRIELGSVTNGIVNLTSIPQGFAFDYKNVSRFGDIQLLQQALVDASGGGAIQVQGNNVSLSDGSLILVRNQGQQGTGNININAANKIELNGTNVNGAIPTGIQSQAIENSSGTDITIVTNKMVTQGGASISSQSFGFGDAGNVSVTASEELQIIGFSSINPARSTSISSVAFNRGNGGIVNLSTKKLTAINGGQMTSPTFGSGAGGDLIVNASDSIDLVGVSSILNPSNLTAVTLSSGKAGRVTVNTSSLAIRDGANVSSASLATGDANSVYINATKSIEVDGTATGTLLPSFIGASTPILTPVQQQVYRLPPVPSGFSGDVTIYTDELRVTNGARVEVSNQGTGNAGRLLINGKSIFLDAQGSITAATASGEGGNIDLQIQDLLLMRHNSQLSATAGGIGNGGNININTPLLVAVPKEDSDIGANSVNSRGGRITINAQGILGTQFRNTPTPESEITATGANPQLNGTVQINTPDIDPARGLTELPVELADPSRLIAQACPIYKGNSFTITGRSGLPSSPREALRNNQTATVDWVSIAKKAEQSRKVNINNQELIIKDLKSKISNSVIEANAWKVYKSGEVQLIASAPNLINTNSSVSACTSDNTVRSN